MEMFERSPAGIILDRVRDGLMSPTQAEQWAVENAERGETPSFALLPSILHPHIFRSDPLKEFDWTLAMALAWVMWRDVNRVREFWNSYRTHCREWKRPDLNFGDYGYRIVRSAPVTARHVILKALYEKNFKASERAEELWRNLRNGSIQAWGYRPHETRPVQIPAFDWGYFRDFFALQTELESVTSPDEDGPLYLRVWIESPKILTKWRYEPWISAGVSRRTWYRHKALPKR